MRPRPLALVLHQPAHWDRLEAALDLELHIPCEIETRRSTGPLLTAPVNRCSAHSASVKPSWISSASTSFPLRGSALGSGASQMAFRADRQRAGCASMCCLKARQTRRSTTRSCGLQLCMTCEERLSWCRLVLDPRTHHIQRLCARSSRVFTDKHSFAMPLRRDAHDDCGC